MRRDDAVAALDSHFVLVSCEGECEAFVFEKLLEGDAIRVPKERLVEDPKTGNLFTPLQSASDIRGRFLPFDYESSDFPNGDGKLVIARIRDRASEGCRSDRGILPVAIPVDFLTRPELEMLIILEEGLLSEYDRERRRRPRTFKPSQFCNSCIGLQKGERSVKSRIFLNRYWDSTEKLIHAINLYRHWSDRSGTSRGESDISDLLRPELIS